jgi:hypothetical protein
MVQYSWKDAPSIAEKEEAWQKKRLGEHGCQSLKSQSPPRLFLTGFIFPYQRSCSTDRDRGTRMSALQQMLSPSRKAGQKPINKIKLRNIRHYQQSNSLYLYI